jgi:hypothetical protein
MSVDDFLDVIKATGAIPVWGVNMSSGERWDRRQDGINEALEMLEYVEEKGADISYWYLDNEPYVKAPPNNHHYTLDEYADAVIAYGTALKKAHPQMKIIVNWHNYIQHQNEELRKLVRKAGKYIDYIDVHYYWKQRSKDFEADWLKVPLVKTSGWKNYTGGSHFDDILMFRDIMREEGHTHIKLASMEWNLGGPNHGALKQGTMKYPSPVDAGLIQGEMLMQFMNAGMEMSAFWRATMPTQYKSPAMKWAKGAYETEMAFRVLFDTDNDFAPRPGYYVFKELFSLKNLAVTESSSSDEMVYTLHAVDTAKNETHLVVLSKKEEAVKLEIAPSGSPAKVRARFLKAASKSRDKLKIVSEEAEWKKGMSVTVDAPSLVHFVFGE